jgi:GTP-binding protein
MSLPIVAIIGRPNVGKSTLFNRIISKREAIVDDTPGITRDRKYAEAEWENVRFALVDTGGYVMKSRDTIDHGVTRQAVLAMEEADLVLFVVDCTSGITDVDGVLARLLKKSRKPWILVVNKVDNKERVLESTEFVRLGLGDSVSISAEGGRGVGDLLSSVVEKLGRPVEKEADAPDDQAIKLAILGRPNVGKSTFINTILGEERLLVTEIPGTTRDPIDVRVRFQKHDFLLIDTAGLRRRSRVKENVEFYSTLRTREVIERCDIACVFMDGEEGLTQQDLRIVQNVTDKKKGVLLAVNKWDLVQGNPEKTKAWENMLDEKLQGFRFIPILTISSKTQLRVNKVLDGALRIDAERKKRIGSPELNRFLEEINRRYQPPAIQGKRVRVLYCTQINVNPPRFAFFCSHPHLVQKSYKNFLENQMRSRFGFEGVVLTLVFRKK